MIYKKYGEVFRRIREQKRFLSEFKAVETPKTTLSKFEGRKSMIGFEKVVIAPQFIHIGLDEFEQMLNGYSLSDTRQILEI